ncbi:MAG: beta-ketoacyl-ACP synthase II [Nitrospirota bacterium]
MRKVVITGIGAVTPLGNDIESTWRNLIEKKSGIDGITRFDPAGLSSRIAGELKGFSPEDYLHPKDILRLDPFVHYAVAAALMACEDAGLTGRNSELLNFAGVIIGSSRGGIMSMEKAMERHLLEGKPFSAYLMSSSTINMASSCISMKLGIKGQAIGISTACASGTNAIGKGLRLIRNGEADIVLAGGAEAPVCRLAVGGYGASGSLSGRNGEPERASRPFDISRDGFVISEGAGVVVLEGLDHALNRKANIYAEVAGYGTSSDAFHQTQPESSGEADAVRRALKNADVEIDEVDYINAHATSTPLGDKAEAEAVRKVFGRHAKDIYISSCKSMLGHMLGAAGAVETAITALSVKRGIIPSTINLENIDPEIDLNLVLSTVNKDITIALSNSFGFGGVNAVLVLRKYQTQVYD